jgi:3-oxoacyl-[acyl-carrier protein] reductase
MDLGLANRVAIVTGAGGGIGAAICRCLGSEGAITVIADIDLGKAQEQAATLAALGMTTLAVAADVIDAESVSALKSKSIEAFGKVDILVNNAGFQRDKRIVNMAESDWDAVVDVILKGAFLCSKAMLPGMVEKHGVTVNAVAPGIVDTATIRGLSHFEKVRENAERTTPIPRLGTVEDIADCVAFLASERASYVSGEVLHVTGGRY